MIKDHKTYLELKEKARQIEIADDCCSMMDGSGDGAYPGMTEEDSMILDAVSEYEDYLNDDPMGQLMGRNE